MLIQLALKYIKTDNENLIEITGYRAAHCQAISPKMIFLEQKLRKKFIK